jgi:propionyl-CoA synthetase
MERTDDAINVAGHRISTGLLEETVLAHPDVPECAVVGVRDEIKGMVPVCVFVRTKNQKEGIEAELVELVREKIGAVAALRTVVGVRDLPKTRSGKILRQVIRKIIDGDEYKVPGTVLDAGVVDEIAEVLAPGKL